MRLYQGEYKVRERGHNRFPLIYWSKYFFGQCIIPAWPGANVLCHQRQNDGTQESPLRLTQNVLKCTVIDRAFAQCSHEYGFYFSSYKLYWVNLHWLQKYPIISFCFWDPLLSVRSLHARMGQVQYRQLFCLADVKNQNQNQNIYKSDSGEFWPRTMSVVTSDLIYLSPFLFIYSFPLFLFFFLYIYFFISSSLIFFSFFLSFFL